MWSELSLCFYRLMSFSASAVQGVASASRPAPGVFTPVSCEEGDSWAPFVSILMTSVPLYINSEPTKQADIPLSILQMRNQARGGRGRPNPGRALCTHCRGPPGQAPSPGRSLCPFGSHPSVAQCQLFGAPSPTHTSCKALKRACSILLAPAHLLPLGGSSCHLEYMS